MTDDDAAKRNQDDEDEPSEDEQEMLNEVDQEVDGNIKLPKNFRGYDDGNNQINADHSNDEQSQHNIDDQNEDMDSASQIGSSKKVAQARKRGESGVSDVDKYAKPLREVHSKYLQYLRKINLDKENNVASVHIEFPLDFKKVLMLTLAEQTLSKVLVRSVPNIEKCKLVKPKKESDELYMDVRGLNFDAFYPYSDIIDVDRIETNHSYAMKSKYGVEAMRANIMKEIQFVFGIYGIQVDPRHLALITDFMTFNGDYRAFNRIGMEESSSPFLKMSYETTMKYLVGASSVNEKDDLTAPSSAIVVGQVPKAGTGMFDLI